MNPRRERSKGEGLPAFSELCVLTDEVVGESWSRLASFPKSDGLSKTETMVDTTGFIQSKFNPVEHNILKSHFEPISSGYIDSFGVPNFSFVFADKGIVIPPIAPVLVELCEPPDLQWWDAFSASAEHHFITLVKEDMSLANMLLELIQVCQGNLIKLQALLAKWKACIKMYLYLLPRYPEKPWLAWNFAMKPFFSDAKKFFLSFRKAMKRLAWLIERSGKDTFVQYREDGMEDEHESVSFGLPHSWFPWGVDKPVGATVEIYDIKRKFQPAALGMINFNADHLHNDFYTLSKVWFQSVGLLNPVKIGWEAFPYSWLIDWFVNKRTQLQLEAGSIAQGLNNATLKQSSHSLKVTIEGSVRLRFGSDTRDYEIGEFQFTRYVRQPGLPKPDVPPFYVDLSWWNASILSALVHQHVRRGRW